MNFAQPVLLGAIAGFTIYLGLPSGRVERTTDQVRAFLTMLSAGSLIFLFFDIFLHIKEPIEEVAKNANVGQAEMISAIGLLVVFVIGFGIGLVGLVVLESRLLRFQREPTAPLTPMRLAMLIAIGSGLHNFRRALRLDNLRVAG